jgi:hypothetical protein
VNWSVAREQLREVLTLSQVAILQNFIEHEAKEAKASQQVNQQVARLTAQFKAQPPAK